MYELLYLIVQHTQKKAFSYLGLHFHNIHNMEIYYLKFQNQTTTPIKHFLFSPYVKRILPANNRPNFHNHINEINISLIPSHILIELKGI